MSIEISTRFDETLPVDLPTLDWSQLFSDPNQGLKNLNQSVVHLGNQAYRFDELFESKSSPGSNQIVWQGRTEKVNGIGYGLDGGHMIVEGNAGDRLGSNLKSGRIEVRGSVGNWLGCENSGGEIHVTGNCGDFAAAALPGKNRGGNGGTITVGGNAGEGLASRLRRGIVAVAGDVGDGTAWEMLAGTVIVGGQIQGHVGNQMKRGTIICKQAPTAGIGPCFTAGYRVPPTAWRLISRFLQTKLEMPWLPALNSSFDCFHGDIVHNSRGELWIAN